ncbi:DNA polymerase III subunit alpha [Azoarcus olearius]|uniref:error-prone DNA polymerase n=1 Tax=Azoarcus sp. (strain BH72) TaxID=418699 RepID=UPI0008062CA0|nr:error-prone DNA polymerase [Azoarcus olearius]ANQ87116.1 DNA polymerase III subunit alpha [Azoarcus olearius]
MATPPYAELHCLSNYSFLRGASHPEELVARAWALGYQGLAITDECSLAGAVRADTGLAELRRDLRAAADAPEASAQDRLLAERAEQFRLVFGAEFRLACGLKLVLLAKNRAGYGNLSALITLARQRSEKGSYRLVRADLDAISPAGAVPDCYALWLPDAASTAEDAHWFARRFGERGWLAVELHSGADDAAWLGRTAELAAAAGLPRLAAGDVHMHLRGRRPLQDTLTAIRLGTTVFEAGTALHPNGERHLRHPLRLARLYPAELLEAAARLALACDFQLDSLRYEYPQEIVPAGETPASYLRRETQAGLARRYPQGVPPAIADNVEQELALIIELGYEPFFLTVYDIVCFARAKGILCQGRGSAANSIVCYALGITEVDPARASLLFGRFISRERDEPPDIDVDFEHDRRETVIQYIYGKYGRDRAALAATVIRYRTRGALRDAGRALGFGQPQIDALARSLAWWDKRDQLPARLIELGLDPASPRVAKWLDLTGMLIGFPRHLSQHVGGFVISRGPLGRLVPIENAAMPERSVIQWDKEDLEALGLLKVDVLALGMLSVIRRSLELVGRRRGAPFALPHIPPKDAATFDMLCAADSVGVFQVESRAQMAMLPRLRPRQFYDLVVQVAIVRPGPIQGDMVHPYLTNRADPAASARTLARLPADVRAVLERTLGVPIFQEQVMKLAEVAAGFTPGEADQLRRAMASWRQKGHIERFKQKLRDGMKARGHDSDFADALCRQIEGFGEYGFPESHAASFALLAYASAWLKRHEPEAFLCGLLNSQPMGFYAPAQLLQDARRHGVEVRPVDVTASAWDATLEDLPADPDAGRRPAVRLGLREISGFPEAAALRVAEARAAAPFADTNDLARRAALQRRELDLLAAAGALQALAGHRRQAAWQVAGVCLQGDLFDAAPPPEATVALAAPQEAEELLADYAATGFSLGRHPLALLRARLARGRFLQAAALARTPDRALVRVAGIVTGRQRPGTAQGVIFVTLEDETGSANVVVYAGLAERQRRELLGARLLGVFGQLQREGEVVHLLAKRLVDLSPWVGGLAARSRDFH